MAIDIEAFPLAPEKIADLIKTVEDGKISNSIAAQRVFPIMVESPEKSALEIATENNWIQETNLDEIEDIVRDTIMSNPAQLQKYKDGNKGLVGFFMGQVMQKTKGKADPKTASELVTKILDEA